MLLTLKAYIIHIYPLLKTNCEEFHKFILNSILSNKFKVF